MPAAATNAHVLPVAMLQLCVGDDAAANLTQTQAVVATAARQGARLIATPECTNLLSPDRGIMAAQLHPEATDPTLRALRKQAQELGVWLLIGSLALKDARPGDDRFVNRSLLIGPDGAVTARYDKIHMFDVTISEHESYRESNSYRPGDQAMLAFAAGTEIGMSICYDLRFPLLFRRLAQAGAKILAVPSAFNDTTGAAHWHALLRARAIETGCFVLAPAQCGTHPAPASPARPARRSYGHSLAVSPWGELLAEGGDDPAIISLSLDLGAVTKARSRIPSLALEADFDGPEPAVRAQ